MNKKERKKEIKKERKIHTINKTNITYTYLNKYIYIHTPADPPYPQENVKVLVHYEVKQHLYGCNGKV